MKNKLPESVRKSVYQAVFEAADTESYLSMDRSASSQFLLNLVASEQVGGLIREYFDDTQIKTYIKDTVLNRYSKTKTKSALNLDTLSLVTELVGDGYCRAIVDGEVELFRRGLTTVNQSDYVVLVKGTYLKWETALRKALLYIPGKPFSATSGDLAIILLLDPQGRTVADSDFRHLREALQHAKAIPQIVL